MPVHELRVVTDRWEWAALVRPVPSVYHSHSWAVAAGARLGHDATVAYVRVYVDDALIGCPIIRVGRVWTSVPRASVAVLRGELADPAGALLATDLPAHLRSLALRDDSAQVDEIASAGRWLEDQHVTVRRYREMDRRVVSQMARQVDWRDDADSAAWMAALRKSWTFGEWAVEMRAYVDGDTALGWAVWATRDEVAECIAVAVGAVAHTW